LFNRQSLAHLSSLDGVTADVVALRARAPPVGPYSEFKRIPDEIEWPEYRVMHPRFTFLPPAQLFRYTVSSRSFRKTLTQYIESSPIQPDVAHAGHIHFDGYGLIPYCEENDIPFFVMGRGRTLNSYPGLPRTGPAIVEETLEKCAGIICVSDDLARIASEIIGSDEKVHTVANGTSPEKFPNDHREEIREELGIPDGDTVVLFVGSFTERKGVKEIATALQSFDQPNTHFLFVGHHGDLDNAIQSAINRANVGSRSKIYHGMPPFALRRLFVAADLLLLPSHAEGRPNVVYEAMASKTAVLATNVGGITEQMVDGETAVLIPPQEPGILRRELESLVTDPDRLAKLGAAGYQRLFDKGWTWDNHAQRIRALHEEAIESRSNA
jgi:glycosyltransferase involved in cell wall biosynthesis